MASDFALGMIGIMVSSLCYGCHFVPIKHFPLGDGLFVQWLKVAGSLFCAVILLLIRKFPQFEPVAMLGGAIWSLANASVVPVLSMAGPQGIMVFGSVSVFFGWATARFGWFGLSAELPPTDMGEIFEYVGISLTVSSAIIFAMVGPSPPRREPNQTIKRGLFMSVDVATINTRGMLTEGFIALSDEESSTTTSDEFITDDNTRVWIKIRNWIVTRRKKLIGIVLAAMAAFLKAQSMTPITYSLQNHLNGRNETNGLDYAYSFSAGGFFGATAFFLAYCLIMRNKPKVNAEVALPGILYGILWAGGQFGVFYATGKISQSVSYPICSRLPSIIMLMWDIFYFKIIRGRRNLMILGAGVAVSITGVVFLGIADVV